MIGGVYIAYPIDLAPPASMAHFYQQIEKFKRDAITAGLVKWVFDPGDAFTVSRYAEPDDSLARINRAALINSDVVVAFLPKDVPTVGVPIEIDRAHSMGKHVLVFTDAHSWMLTLPRLWKANGFDDEHLDAGLQWLANLEVEDPFPSRKYLEVKYVGPEEMRPYRKHHDDAGLDLYVAEDTVVPLGEFRDVPCGISCELPEGTWGLLTGRSSALRTHGLLVHSGIIDGGYRGPLFAGAFSMQRDVELKKGERIAQLILMSNTTERAGVVRVEDLSPSERGTKGFGSTGA